MSRNLAESNQAVEAPQESDSKLARFIELSPLGIAISTLEGDIIEANTALWMMFGYKSQEDFSQTPVDAHWYNLEEKEKFMALSKIGEVKNFEAKFQRKDGRIFWGSVSSNLQTNGTQSQIIGFFQDISRQKTMLETLKESEKKYRGMAERTLDPIAAISADGYFLYLSPAVERVFAFRPEELMGQFIGKIFPKTDLPKAHQVIKEVMQGDPVESLELEIRRKDQSTAYVEVSATPMIEVEDGSPVSVQATFRDITERRLSDEKFKRQKEELSEFAHAMAHDLRNYLVVVKGYVDLLQSKTEPVYIETIVKTVAKMDNLLQRSVVLADAGLIVEATTEVDLNQLIKDAAEVTIPEDIIIEQDKLPKVMGDPEKIVQAFKNLFENAVTHGKPEKIEARYRRTEESIDILIVNDGTAIPRQYRPRLFQRGFTTKKGGGLGLTIVKKLIEAHGWQIHLEATPKTTFCISIPA